MASILIFAGTTEGRKIAEYLRGHAPEVYVCTATEYGKELVEEGQNIHVLAGRLDVTGMQELARECQAQMVIDATHPFAVEVSGNIRTMCGREEIRYVRVLREGDAGTGRAVWVESIREAAQYLGDKKGNILITTGSKELDPYTRIPDYKNRCFLRVLSTKEAVEQAVSHGFEGQHLLAMQGPFSREMNEQTLRHVRARYLVTKDSGRAGGFREKMEAAEAAGAVPVVIGRPREKGISLQETMDMLAKKYGFRQPRKITLAGIGPGGADCQTLEAREAMEQADLLIGSARMLAAAEGIPAEHYEEYRAGKIREFIGANSRFHRIVILLSGDTSFYSGAARLKEELRGYDVTVLPGISSVSCLAARLGAGLEGTPCLSIHGRSCNYLDYLREYGRLFLLVSSPQDVETVLARLCRYGWKKARVSVGSRLTYPEERIITGRAQKLAEKEIPWDPLSVLYMEAPGSGRIPSGTRDEDYLRGRVPMTKSEVRAVILSCLEPERGDVMWDVGAGTGSVSLQMARRALDGMVYAVERNQEAVGLIQKNRHRLRVSNVLTVRGEAPGILRALPAPDKVFVGGSSGNLSEILKKAWEKNPQARIVVSAITLNTAAACMDCMRLFPEHPAQITQIQASRARKAGSFQLMEGLNPVYIVTFEGVKQAEGERK